jgi:hypothetical protein
LSAYIEAGSKHVQAAIETGSQIVELTEEQRSQFRESMLEKMQNLHPADWAVMA